MILVSNNKSKSKYHNSKILFLNHIEHQIIKNFDSDNLIFDILCPTLVVWLRKRN